MPLFKRGRPAATLKVHELVEIAVTAIASDALEELVGPRRAAILRCEPSNKHDFNTIRVEVADQLAGYVTPKTASMLAPPMRLGCGGTLAAISVIGRGDDSRIPLGVRVWIDEADLRRIAIDPRHVRSRRPS